MLPEINELTAPNAMSGTDFPFKRMGELPIFTRSLGQKFLYYSPGYLAVVDRSIKEFFDQTLVAKEPQGQVSTSLLKHAEQFSKNQDHLPDEEFKPTCLTVYMGNRCNLACRYCYSFLNTENNARDTLTTGALHQALRIVAKNSQSQGKPLTVVLHGGGEPTLYRNQIDPFLDEVSSTAKVLGLATFFYIATNAAITTGVADWLARRFDLVGISCDGPADIQDHQRPTKTGKATSSQLERTARILRASGVPFHVRVTITPQTTTRQCEIIKYICEILDPIEIHLEPVYAGGRTRQQDINSQDQALLFVSNFLSARKLARHYGVPLQLSDIRPWELHGRYCQTERDVLQLIPGDGISACFKTATLAQAEQKGLLIGRFKNGKLGMCEAMELNQLRQEFRNPPPGCLECFAYAHCTYGCPDICAIDQDNNPGGSFRCLVNRLILAEGLQTMSTAIIQNSIPIHKEDRAIGSQILKEFFL